MAGIRDAQSHASCKLNQNNCKQNSPWDPLNVGGTRCFEQAMDWCLLVEGEYKLYHSIWEPPIMCVAWKISPSLGCYVDNESIPLKILFISISKSSSGTSTNPCFPLRRAYLFTFMFSHHPLIKNHQLESTTVICMHYYVSTPILSHTNLAYNTSYHFAASRMVFPRVSPYQARDRLRLLAHVYDSAASIHMIRSPGRHG